jgi:hypothetical protein
VEVKEGEEYLHCVKYINKGNEAWPIDTAIYQIEPADPSLILDE